MKMPIVADNYKLSLTQDDRVIRIRCSQNDTSRQVKFTIYNNGMPFIIPTGLSVSVHGIKQNGAIYSKVCSYSGSVVTLNLDTQITNVAGISVAELVFTDSSGGKIGTSNFIFQVESDPLLKGKIGVTEETPTEYISDLVLMIEALSARVNNIVAPEGEASLSEVVDARTSGYSGTIYQNLKSRLDADFAALDNAKSDKSNTYTKEEIDSKIDDIEIITDETLSVSGVPADSKKVGDTIIALNEHFGMLYFPVEKGNFTASGDSDSVASVKYYCRTVSGFWIESVNNAKIIIFNKNPDKYKLSIARYDVNGNYITATLWINENAYEYNVMSGYKYRVRFTTLTSNIEIFEYEISNNFMYEFRYLDIPVHIDFFDNSWKLSINVDRGLENYILPSDFSTADFPINIYTDKRKYFYTFNDGNFKNTGGNTYYCKPYNANESDGDGTKENPIMLYTYLTTLQADGDTLILRDGVYCDLAKVKNSANKIHKNINIIAENCRHVIFVGNEYGYSAVQMWVKNNNSRTYINNNSSYVNGATKIVQKFMGRFFALQKVDTYALCNSTEGTWYKEDDNSSPYIHLFGNEVPTYANVFVNRTILPILYCNSDNQNINLYLEGLIFIGGGNGGVLFRNSQTYLNPKLCAIDCDFLHSYDGDLSNDAISILGANAYFVRCRAMYASKDGFNYHKYNDVPANFIEIDCIGSNNGVDGVAESNPSSIAYSQNGSTSHDNAKGIRINGLYYNNYGTNIADVSGAKTVNIQCAVYEGAETEGGDKYDCDFGTITDNGNSIMYLESCRCFGTKNSVYVAVGTEMHVNHSDLKGDIINNGTLYVDGVLAN